MDEKSKQYLVVYSKIVEQLGCTDLEKAMILAAAALGIANFNEQLMTDALEHLKNCTACMHTGGLVQTVCEIHNSRLTEHNQNIKAFFNRLTGKDISDIVEASVKASI